MFLSFEDVGPKLTREDIFDHIDEEQIYKAWCSDFPKKVCKRPWPGEKREKHMSFGFFQRGKKWMWKDHARDEAGDVFKFVGLMEGTDYHGALALIAERFHITVADLNPIIIKQRFDKRAQHKAEERSRSLIQIVQRPMHTHDYEWWNRLLITPGILNGYYVGAGREVWVDKKIIWYNKDENPIYYLLSPITKNVKAYRPLERNKDYKFLSSMDPLYDVHGYHQCQIKLNPGRPMLITKSFKDVMFFRAFGINAISNTSETTNWNMDFIRHLKKYCFPILGLYDTDIAGIKGLRKLKQHGIPGMIMPLSWKHNYGAKDPTDLWLSNYRKVYDLLNFIYGYFEQCRLAGSYLPVTGRLYHPGEAA
jgi:hypothetical protein